MDVVTLGDVDTLYLPRVKFECTGSSDSIVLISDIDAARAQNPAIQSSALVEWVDVPLPQASSTDHKRSLRLLKIPLGNGLKITLDIATGNRSVSNLTFVRTSSKDALTRLLVYDFKRNPNIHTLENTMHIGDVDANSTLTWSWDWKHASGETPQYRGWQNYCALVEYDRDSNSFSELASFQFWVHDHHDTIVQALPERQRLSLVLPPNKNNNDNFTAEKAEPVIVTPVQNEGGDASGENHEHHEHLPFEMSPPNAHEAIRIRQLTDEGSNLNDGPTFRSNISEYEKSNSQIRHRVKAVLKSAENLTRLQKEYKYERDTFMQTLREAVRTNPSASTVLQKVLDQFNHVQDLYAADMENVVAKDLRKLYSNDVRSADFRRKEFEDESREWYNTQSRYLAKKDSHDARKQVEKDIKYIAKRKDWDVKRLEYFSFLQDLHGGRMEQQLLSILMRFAIKQFDAHEKALSTARKARPELEALSLGVQEAERDFEFVKFGREERRRALEVSSSLNSSMMKSPDYLNSPTLGQESYFFNTSIFSGTSEPLSRQQSVDKKPKQGAPIKRVRGFTESDQNGSEYLTTHKEGILYASSRPFSHADPGFVLKMNWHKYWVTINKDQLVEFSNWKSSMEIHNEPINLQIATVREARSAERRFCFEVITPSFTRIYQATSDEEVASWIAAISRAIEGCLTIGPEKGAEKAKENAKTEGSMQLSKLFGLPRRSSGSKASQGPGTVVQNASSQDMIPLGSNTTNIDSKKTTPERPTSPLADPEAIQLIRKVKQFDMANYSCADCRKEHRVEWMSINIGSMLCIDCAGLHRGLGSHISKIRSLKLDTGSFTPELLSICALLGNTLNREVWECKLIHNKYDVSSLDWSPSSSEPPTQEQRAAFIKAKYSDRKFISGLSIEPNQLLVKAIRENDIQSVSNAIAHSADLNMTSKSNETPLELSLAHASSLEPSEQKYALAGYLILNGAAVISPESERFEKLDPAAKEYLRMFGRRTKLAT